MSASLQLLAYIPIAWDRFKNAIGVIGVRESTGSMLERAISHTSNMEHRLPLVQLHRAFISAGGQPGEAEGDRLAFPRRQPPSRAAAPRTVHLPLRSAEVVEAEPIEVEVAE